MATDPPILTPEPGDDPPGDAAADPAADDGLDALGHRKRQGLLALLNESTVLGAAKASGIPERTLHSWIREPAFKKELRRLQREAFSHSVALAQRYSPVAMTVLAQIATDKSAPHSARVQASNSMLKHGRESLELDDLAERVEGLEEQQKQREDKR